MPDEEKGGDKGEDAKGGEGEKNEDGTPKVEKRTCCDKFSECLVLGFQKTAKCITNTCSAMGTACSYCWYPMKECCKKSCDKCANKRHPWKDPSYHQI